MSKTKNIIQFICMSLIILIILISILMYKNDLDSYLNQLDELSVNCKCKLRTIQRIVNGRIQNLIYVPWQVSIAIFRNHYCMGTILNSYFILTAQHCLNNSKDAYDVRVGLFELFDPKLNAKTYRIKEIFKFSKFNFSNSLLGGDLALIELKKPIQFEIGLVEPACLDFNSYLIDDAASSNGFKFINNSTAGILLDNLKVNSTYSLTSNSSDNLKSIDIFLTSGFGTKMPVYFKENKLISKIIPSLVLQTSYFIEVIDLFKSDARLKPFLEMFISLEPIDKDNNACHGSSGGSLNFERKDSLIAVKGIASTSIPIQINETTIQYCKSYSMFTRLSYKYYRDFIENTVGDLRCKIDLIVSDN